MLICNYIESLNSLNFKNKTKNQLQFQIRKNISTTVSKCSLFDLLTKLLSESFSVKLIKQLT